MLFDGYLNHVRQALFALPQNKHIVYHNAMQGTTQAHLLVKLLKSRTLSSFHKRQEVTKIKNIENIYLNHVDRHRLVH